MLRVGSRATRIGSLEQSPRAAPGGRGRAPATRLEPRSRSPPRRPIVDATAPHLAYLLPARILIETEKEGAAMRLRSISAAVALIAVFALGLLSVTALSVAAHPAAKCTATQHTKNHKALTAFKKQMAKNRAGYFRTHKSPKLRAKFVKSQKARLAASRRRLPAPSESRRQRAGRSRPRSRTPSHRRRRPRLPRRRRRPRRRRHHRRQRSRRRAPRRQRARRPRPRRRRRRRGRSASTSPGRMSTRPIRRSRTAPSHGRSSSRRR